jgi:SAM-dependent methyltransferase
MKEFTDSVQKQLLVAGRLNRFPNWLFEQIQPFIGGTVWEAGCGTGTYTHHMLAAGCERILATDYDADLLQVARRRFAGNERVLVFSLDMSQEVEFEKLKGHAIQTIVCLNVLEHIENDLLVLRNMRALLPPKGRLILLVPAHPCLFNGMDESLHHYRRYTARDLSTKLRAADYRVIKLYYFNAPAILGWFAYGHILRRKSVTEGLSTGLFDWLVPLFRWTERAILKGRLGISLIAMCERAE